MIRPTIYRQHTEFFCLNFKMIRNCRFFTETLSSNRFFGRIECSTDILRLFSIQCSKTNFHSVTQCPKTTNSVLSVQKIFTSPHGSTGRIHWKHDKPNTPPPRSSAPRAGNISWRYDNERKNLNFHFFHSSSEHLENTFSWLL